MQGRGRAWGLLLMRSLLRPPRVHAAGHRQFAGCLAAAHSSQPTSSRCPCCPPLLPARREQFNQASLAAAYERRTEKIKPDRAEYEAAKVGAVLCPCCAALCCGGPPHAASHGTLCMPLASGQALLCGPPPPHSIVSPAPLHPWAPGLRPRVLPRRRLAAVWAGQALGGGRGPNGGGAQRPVRGPWACGSR